MTLRRRRARCDGKRISKLPNESGGAWRLALVSIALSAAGACAESPTRPGRDGRTPGQFIWRVTDVHARTRPGVGATLVIVVDAERRVQAFDQRTGQARWSTPLPGSASSDIMPDVAVVGGHVVVGVDAVHGLDLASGAVRWTHALPAGQRLGALLVASDEATVYLPTRGPDASVRAIEVGSGQLRWAAVAPAGRAPGSAAIVFDPVVHDDAVVFTYARNPALLGSPEPQEGGVVVVDRATGRPRWTRAFDLLSTSPAPATAMSGPAAGHGRVYASAGHGAVYAFDAASGRTLWVDSADARDGPEAGSIRPVAVEPAGAAGAGSAARPVRLYVSTWQGEMRALDAATGARLWTIPPLHGTTFTMTATLNGLFAVHIGGQLSGLDRTGSVRVAVRPPVGYGFFFAPRIVGDTIFAAGRGGLWAIQGF